jgi:hypothetical protein
MSVHDLEKMSFKNQTVEHLVLLSTEEYYAADSWVQPIIGGGAVLVLSLR